MKKIILVLGILVVAGLVYWMSLDDSREIDLDELPSPAPAKMTDPGDNSGDSSPSGETQSSFKEIVNTDSWQTYTNVPMGFSFKFDINYYSYFYQGSGDPSMAKPRNGSGLVYGLKVGSLEDVRISYWPKSVYKDLNSYLLDSRPSKKRLAEHTIDGKKAYLVINLDPEDNYQSLAIENNGIYEISFPQIKGESSELSDIQKTILASFAF